MIPVILVKLKAFSSTKHNQKDLSKKERKKERFTWSKNIWETTFLHGTAILQSKRHQKKTTQTGLTISPFSLFCVFAAL
jgi:hypothetical protein